MAGIGYRIVQAGSVSGLRSRAALADASDTADTTPQYQFDLSARNKVCVVHQAEKQQARQPSGHDNERRHRQGVDLQLTDRNFDPAAFRKKTIVGMTPAGKLSLPYYALLPRSSRG
jgi:hypothetical protein